MRLLLTLAWMTFVAGSGLGFEAADDEEAAVRSQRAVLSEFQQKCKDNQYSSGMKKYEYDELRQYDQRRENYGSNRKKPCSSPSVNARGFYTSHLVACTFQFYQISKDKKEDVNLSNALSTACFDNNASPMETVQASEYYVVRWEDECVADFARCYHVERDEQILLKQICVHGLIIPTGATHVTVDCTKDKLEKEAITAENTENSKDMVSYGCDTSESARIKDESARIKDKYDRLQMHYDRLQMQYEHHTERLQSKVHRVTYALVGICLFVGCCFCCFIYRYRYIVQSYLMATIMKRSRTETEFSRLYAVVE